MIKPWEKIGQQYIVAESQGKKFILQKYENPITGNIIGFSALEALDSAIILALTTYGDVILSKEFKQGRDCVDIEVPGGALDENETPQNTAVRELLEETGYKAGSIVLSLGYFWINGRNFKNKVHIFLSEGCTKIGNPQHHHDEITEIVLKPLEELKNLVFDGQINDPGTNMALIRAIKYL